MASDRKDRIRSVSQRRASASICILVMLLVGCGPQSTAMLEPGYDDASAPRRYVWTPLTSDLSATCYSSTSGVWAVGSRGAIFHAADGHTWVRVSSSVHNHLYAISCGEKNMVAVGEGGILLRSSDGEVWTASVITDQVLLSVYAEDESRKIWAVGEHGAILHTDNGEKWNTQESRVGVTSRSISGSRKDFWISGDEGTLLHSGDGLYWDKQQAPAGALTSVYVAPTGIWVLGSAVYITL